MIYKRSISLATCECCHSFERQIQIAGDLIFSPSIKIRFWVPSASCAWGRFILNSCSRTSYTQDNQRLLLSLQTTQHCIVNTCLPSWPGRLLTYRPRTTQAHHQCLHHYESFASSASKHASWSRKQSGSSLVCDNTSRNEFLRQRYRVTIMSFGGHWVCIRGLLLNLLAWLVVVV